MERCDLNRAHGNLNIGLKLNKGAQLKIQTINVGANNYLLHEDMGSVLSGQSEVALSVCVSVCFELLLALLTSPDTFAF